MAVPVPPRVLDRQRTRSRGTNPVGPENDGLRIRLGQTVPVPVPPRFLDRQRRGSRGTNQVPIPPRSLDRQRARNRRTTPVGPENDGLRIRLGQTVPVPPLPEGQIGSSVSVCN